MARYLVTGGAGFIGSHLVERLLADGHTVAVLDGFDDLYPRANKELNLRGFVHHARCQFHEVDLRDADRLEHIWSEFGPDLVFHLAARAGVRSSIENPRQYFETNVPATVNVLEAARRLGTERLIFASSSSVYGNQTKLPFSEEDPTDRPISPYAAGKKMGEQLCYTYHHAYGLSVTCLRFFSVYGPRCRSDMAVARFTRAIDRGEPVSMYGDGSSARDYTYIDDILDGILSAADRCQGFGIFNLGRSEPVLLRDLIAAVASALGKPARVLVCPAKPGDVERTCADLARSRRALGYEPRISLAEGLARYVAWYRQHTAEYGEDETGSGEVTVRSSTSASVSAETAGLAPHWAERGRSVGDAAAALSSPALSTPSTRHV